MCTCTIQEHYLASLFFSNLKNNHISILFSYSFAGLYNLKTMYDIREHYKGNKNYKIVISDNFIGRLILKSCYSIIQQLFVV